MKVIFDLLARLKAKLATVPDKSWRWRLIQFGLMGKVQPKKACTMYWFWLPASAVLAGALVVVFVALAFVLLCIAAIGLLFGYAVNASSDGLSFYDYRHHPRFEKNESFLHHQRENFPAPWWFWLPAVVLYLLFVEGWYGAATSATVPSGVYWWGVYVASALAFLGLIGKASQRWLLPVAKSVYGRHCPDLNVVPSEARNIDEAHV